MISEYLAAFLLISGGLVSLLAAVGVLRLQDAFMRMHAATKSGVVGCGLVLVGVAIAEGTWATSIKVAVAVGFLLLTTPVAGHLLARAAYVSGAPFWARTRQDQLSAELPRRRFPSDAP